MQVFRKWIAVCFVLRLIATPAAALENTDQNIFEQYGECLEYRSFLSGRSDYSATACYELPEFLMVHADLSHQDFIIEAARNYHGTSGLSMMLATLFALTNSDERDSFYWADQADRTMFAKMQVSQDYSRANLYTLLLAGIKYELLHILCEPSGCELGQIKLSATDELGEGFSIVDQVSFDVALMCLLRTDGFVIPVSEVVANQRFQACISQN